MGKELEILYKGFVEIEGKKPKQYIKDETSFYSYSHARQRFESYGGVLKDEIVMVDVDSMEEAEMLLKIVTDHGIQCNVLKTTNGMHFYFLNTDLDTNKIKRKTAIGITIDIKLGSKNTVDPLKINGVRRQWLRNSDAAIALPKYLVPLSGGAPTFTRMDEGDGRNQELFNYILTLQTEGFSKDSIREVITLVNKYMLKTPVDQKELDTILRDEAFLKQSFYSKSRFLHDQFAKFIKEEEHIVKINNQLHIYKDGIYKNDTMEIETAMIKHLPELNKAKRYEALNYLELISNSVEPSYENHNLIAFENGILNITDDSLLGHSPNYIITNKIPWDYNPGAYSELLDKTLDRISCNDSEIRCVLEELIGYTFYRRNEIGKAFILTGEKQNGKSTFLDMMTTLLGVKNIAALDLKDLGERFKTAELLGKLANIGDDVGDEFIAEPSMFKKLVTGDRVNVERKGKDPFDFNNYSKLLFSANNIPRVKDKTGAVQRRLLIIPFKARFTADDPDFRLEIKYELRARESMEYLIILGLKGLKRVLQNNGFTKSIQVENELKEYENTNNPIIEFYEENEAQVPNQPTKDVYRKYYEYCLSNNLQPLSHIEFSRQITKRFDFKTIDKKIDGKKHRIFIKL